jgi:uncharacterized metal-binding protein YceD (DUF177 family)
MTLNEKGMQAVINSQESLIKELVRELKEAKRSNLRIRLHMQVLVSNPSSRTAEDVRGKYQVAMQSESILHMN